MVQLTGIIYAHRDRNTIAFRENKPGSGAMHVELGSYYDFNGFRISLGTPEPVPAEYTRTREIEYIDAGRIGRQLILRSWHEGDWFIPLGMKGRKKLSDFFTDQKIPRFVKTTVPVLESDGSIVWICGRRLDERFKLTERSKTAVRLAIRLNPWVNNA
jgi:tRNA(Ile)-lysidine synthase